MVDFVLLSLAFSAGIVTFFNPCIFAMFPAYIVYHLSRPTADHLGKEIAEGLKAGIAASLGFVSVFLTTGALVSFFGTEIGQLLPWTSILIGGILIGLGCLWLVGAGLSIPLQLPAPLRRSFISFFIFGIGYAITSAACALPVFLMIILTAIGSGGFYAGFLIFLAYSLGMVVPMITLAAAVSMSKSFTSRYFERFMPFVRKVGAAILIIAGAYLIYIHVKILSS